MIYLYLHIKLHTWNWWKLLLMIKGTAQRLWVGTFINLQKRDSKLLKTFRATDLEDRNQIAENISSISFITPLKELHHCQDIGTDWSEVDFHR